jgi:NTP pyrophosphatase (non-canonical NTP hydrolase)
MNWNEYKVLSEKTQSLEFHSGKQAENLLHGVLGVVTELDELMDWNDEVNKKEEVADVFWYLALLDRELNLNLKLEDFSKSFSQLNNNALIMKSFRLSNYLLDCLKKKLYYNKPIDSDDFSMKISEIFECMEIFCHHNSIDVSSILETNIQKLKARYGDKFSSDKAINRNLNKERQILEN